MKYIALITAICTALMLTACGKSEDTTADTETPKQSSNEASGAQQLSSGELVSKGQQLYVLCQACHAVEAGGPRKIGPHLAGVMGRGIASVETFNYSPALKKLEGSWNSENMDEWLTATQKMAPGNMMAFPGMPDANARAALIAYLGTL